MFELQPHHYNINNNNSNNNNNYYYYYYYYYCFSYYYLHFSHFASCWSYAMLFHTVLIEPREREILQACAHLELMAGLCQ